MILLFKIGIVEDNIQDKEKLIKLINEYLKKENITYTISTFSYADNFLNSNKVFDLVFLDIILGGDLTGIDIAKKVRGRLGNDLIIVFVTSSIQFALEGYSVDASAYIMKPVIKEDFELKMPRIINKLKNKSTNSIILNTNEETLSINVRDIFYIEVYGHYLTYYVNDKKYIVRQTLSSAEDRLSKYGLFRINKYNLVNINNINKIDGDDVYIKNIILRISRSRKQKFKKVLLDRYV